MHAQINPTIGNECGPYQKQPNHPFYFFSEDQSEQQSDPKMIGSMCRSESEFASTFAAYTSHDSFKFECKAGAGPLKVTFDESGQLVSNQYQQKGQCKNE